MMRFWWLKKTNLKKDPLLYKSMPTPVNSYYLRNMI